MSKSWLTPHDPQWDLIAVMTQVRSGALTPDQAEEWAKANGYGPFVPEANDNFIAERYWPFALAMAWIATREEAAAVRLWGGYKTWGTRQYELDDRLAPARDLLLKELRKGELVASGRANWQGPHEAAPTIVWLDLHLVRYGSHDRFCREDDLSPTSTSSWMGDKYRPNGPVLGPAKRKFGERRPARRTRFAA
jgi:hypothetical protein